MVEQIARETEPFASLDLGPIKTVVLRTIDEVAEHYHPGEDQPRLRMALIDFLLLVERLARNVRTKAVTSVPGARLIYASHVSWLMKQGPQVKNLYERADWAFRFARPIFDTQGAILTELGRALRGGAHILMMRINAALTSLLIRECGRAAIDLYSGACGSHTRRLCAPTRLTKRRSTR